MRKALFLGIDLGTSALKCGVWSADGERHGSARQDFPGSGAPAQDAEAWWRATIQGVRQATRGIDQRRIEAIGIGGQAPSPVFVDARTLPVASVSTWVDLSSAPEHERLLNNLGRAPRSGHERLALQMAARVAWLRHRDPHSFARTTTVLHSADFLVARMTGRCVSSSPGAVEVFAACDLAGLLGDEVTPGQEVAAVTAVAGRKLGLPAGVRVVAGGLDSFLGSVGSGISEPGDVCLIGGSSAIIALLSAPGGGGGARFRLQGMPLWSRPVRISGRALQWGHDLVAPDHPMEELIDAASLLEPNGEALPEVLCPPVLCRRHTNDDEVRAAVTALARHAARPRFFRRVIDAILLAERFTLERMTVEAGETYGGRVRLVGGQARHPRLHRLRAEVLGRDIEVPQDVDSGALGAAMLAAIATGHAANHRTAAERMVKIARVESAGGAASAAYETLYRACLRTNQPARSPEP